MLNRRNRAIIIIFSVLILANSLYVAVLFNPQVTGTQVMLPNTKTDLTSVNGETKDLYVHHDIIYGIDSPNFRANELFAYSDHYIFETQLRYAPQRDFLELITDTGIFVDTGFSIDLYDLQGQFVQTLDNPEMESAIPSNSSYMTSGQYQYWMTQTNDAIYRISIVSQVSYLTTSISGRIYTHFLNIQGWKLPLDATQGLGTPDLEQNVILNDSSLALRSDIQFHHSFSKDSMDIIYTTNIDQQIKFQQYEMNLNGFKERSSTLLKDTSSNTNSIMYYYTLAGTIFSFATIFSNSPNDHSDNFVITNLGTNQQLNITLPGDNDVKVKIVDNSLLLYGGIKGGSSNNNKLHAILFQIFVSDGKLGMVDVLGDYTSSNINPISSLAISGNNLYITTGITALATSQADELFVYNHALRQSVFAPGISPGVQLNVLGLLIILIYSSVEYYKYRNQVPESEEIDLTFPENKE